ncbi:outer membrane beta-barrel protein [Chitinophaga sancti]|uniref:outer membrane beta-barrel protein n=1 Tax=Chitinophaga sancti TaxID=1004 RepID=UPI002A764D69|nr:outer membrane beta-barrel protein [Chitinophaga sancti]WPQ64384.1 outer membrane beta-barrel protein [Chitinophaga sancti]
MKCKVLRCLILLLFICAGVHAQTADTIQVKGLIIVQGKDAKGKRIFKVYNDTAYARTQLKRNLQTRWFVLDLGYNNYIDRSDYNGAAAYALYGSPSDIYFDELNKSYTYSAAGLNTLAPRTGSSPLTPSEFKLIAGKSVNVNIWLFQQRLNIYRHKLNLIYSLGVEMNNYRFARNITYVPGYPTTIMRDTVSFSKNKLFVEYLSVPVMLNYNSNPTRPSRAFKMSMGVMGGYLVKARTKQISKERGKVKKVDDFNLNKWRLSITGDVGYGPVKLYGNFALTPLHDYGLEQYPFSVGLRFNGF